VDVLPEEDLSSDEALELLWECGNQAECVGVCEDLRSANIRYHVDEIPYEKTARMGVEWHYRILISANDLDRAKELLSIDAPQNTIPSSDADEEEIVDPTVELPDAGVPLTAETKRDTYLDPWYPEDATVEVWSQDGDDLSLGIELSLDANRIHCRCDSDEPGDGVSASYPASRELRKLDPRQVALLPFFGRPAPGRLDRNQTRFDSVLFQQGSEVQRILPQRTPKLTLGTSGRLRGISQKARQ